MYQYCTVRKKLVKMFLKFFSPFFFIFSEKEVFFRSLKCVSLFLASNILDHISTQGKKTYWLVCLNRTERLYLKK